MPLNAGFMLPRSQRTAVPSIIYVLAVQLYGYKSLNYYFEVLEVFPSA